MLKYNNDYCYKIDSSEHLLCTKLYSKSLMCINLLNPKNPEIATNIPILQGRKLKSKVAQLAQAICILCYIVTSEQTLCTHHFYKFNSPGSEECIMLSLYCFDIIKTKKNYTLPQMRSTVILI